MILRAQQETSYQVVCRFAYKNEQWPQKAILRGAYKNNLYYLYLSIYEQQCFTINRTIVKELLAKILVQTIGNTKFYFYLVAKRRTNLVLICHFFSMWSALCYTREFVYTQQKADKWFLKNPILLFDYLCIAYLHKWFIFLTANLTMIDVWSNRSISLSWL